MLKRIAIFSKENNAKSRDSVGKLIEVCIRKKISVMVHNRKDEPVSNPVNGIEYFHDFSEAVDLPDVVFSIGGDGTFLETITIVKDTGIPIAGINTGRMGFLANISTDGVERSVEMLSRNEFTIIERFLLELSKPAGLFPGNASSALNEITVQKSDLSMITISVYVNDVFLNTYWSDGLIISTATGSTAYNLSVGGPILSPDDESIIILPIAPHNLTVRPIVISGNFRLRMVVEGRSNEYLATVDYRSRKVPFTEEVHITKSPVKIKTVMLDGMDFYSTLRNKLMWGLDKRN